MDSQDPRKEAYLWRMAMRPSVLTADQERAKALRPDRISRNARTAPDDDRGWCRYVHDGLGEGEGNEDAHPQHEATISRPFGVGKYDVAFAEWDVCVAAGACPQGTGHGRGGATDL
jgi:formylglycine-generating enzyme required for sulfatase activity